jgi:hypothetical protein
MTQPNPSHQPPPVAAAAPSEPSRLSGASEPPGASGERAGSRLLAGAVLLIVALVLFAASRVVAAGQRHAYDPGASPPASYAVTAGTSYQLSAARSVSELKKAGLLGNLACFTTSATGEQTPLTLSSVADDDRNLHLFATFVAPATGSVQVSCTGIPGVFVDDADDAAPDRSAVLVLLSGAIGLLGVIAACSGGYARRPRAELH